MIGDREKGFMCILNQRARRCLSKSRGKGVIRLTHGLAACLVTENIQRNS